MVVSSWFKTLQGSGGVLSEGNDSNFHLNHPNSSTSKTSIVPVKDIIKYLVPHKRLSQRLHNSADAERSRFSQLLLEHGERHLQDWAVMAQSKPLPMPSHSKDQTPFGASSVALAAAAAAAGSPSHNNGVLSNPSLHSSASSTVKWLQRVPSPSSHPQHCRSSSLRASSPRYTTSTAKAAAASWWLDTDAAPNSLHMTRQEGRLHLCSRSLVFEPLESSRGIVRIPFHKMLDSPRYDKLEEESNNLGGSFEAMCVELEAMRHSVMMVNNVVGPYETIPVTTHFQFTFLHSSPATFVDLCQKLFHVAASSMNRPKKQDSKSRNPSTAVSELDLLLQPMMDRPFDLGNLVHVREVVLAPNLKCSIRTPLQSKPGVLLMTAERIYFQPATGVWTSDNSNMMPSTRAIHWLQRDVMATARRYCGLRDSALEIYWKDETSTLMAFERRHDREMTLRLIQKTVPCLTDREFVIQAYADWQNGDIGNYDYLLVLNAAAGRSFHDLSRYPVFPWVIADYHSLKLDLSKESTFRDLTKPMGALNDKRLEYFRQRLQSLEELGENAFLYGTHYSAPGYILYFLVRSMPEHMLCLQNGKFDSPDRMFHSIAHCYYCVLNNHADVKELIPEFYNDGKDFDFLLNARGLQLGATQNGERVDDVQLPPWARSARDFVKKNRQALESDICTRDLPRWIDLIFGSKSRGDAALHASNLFHRMAYLGPNDLADMQTHEERVQAELQATEFGIVPDQLFSAPHPLKHRLDRAGPHMGDCLVSPEEFVSVEIGRASSNKEDGREAWELLDSPSQHVVEESRLRSGSTDQSGNPHAVDMADRIAINDRPKANDRLTSLSSGAVMSDASAKSIVPLRGIGQTSQQTTSHANPFQGPTSARDEAPVLVAPPSSDNSTNALQSPTSSSEQLPSVQQRAKASPSISSWDMKIIERKRIHGDTVSASSLHLDDESGGSNTNASILATTSLDGGLMIHTVTLDSSSSSSEARDPRGFTSTLTRLSYSTILSGGQLSRPVATSKMQQYRAHSSRDPLASLVLASDGAGGWVAFAGGHDDIIMAYGVNSACAVASVYSHRDAVTGLDLLTRTPLDRDSALWLENATHIMVSGSWDATVKVWSVSVASGEVVSIHREPVAELFDADSSIVCVSAKLLPGGGIVIAAGSANGCFTIWNVHNDGVQVLMHQEPAKKGSGPCSVVQWVTMAGNQMRLFTAFATGKVASYSLIDGVLQRLSAVSVGVPVLSMVYMDGNVVAGPAGSALLVGCIDGGLRLIPINHLCKFELKPTLWPAVNSKSSPGISSIGITYKSSRDNPNGPSRCICTTGAEDGSVVLFELSNKSKP